MTDLANIQKRDLIEALEHRIKHLKEEAKTTTLKHLSSYLYAEANGIRWVVHYLQYGEILK